MRETLLPEVERERVQSGLLKSDPSFGRNGFFIFKRRRSYLFCQVSDGEGWEHVSIHAEDAKGSRTPTWAEMCYIKDLFWMPEECVIQYHPPKSKYKNLHPDVLHLWRPTRVEIPLPPREFV